MILKAGLMAEQAEQRLSFPSIPKMEGRRPAKWIDIASR
jgi:hypothetical protein